MCTICISLHEYQEPRQSSWAAKNVKRSKSDEFLFGWNSLKKIEKQIKTVCKSLKAKDNKATNLVGECACRFDPCSIMSRLITNISFDFYTRCKAIKTSISATEGLLFVGRTKDYTRVVSAPNSAKHNNRLTLFSISSRKYSSLKLAGANKIQRKKLVHQNCHVKYSPCKNISEMIIHIAATKLNQLQNPRFFLVMFKQLYAYTALIFCSLKKISSQCDAFSFCRDLVVCAFLLFALPFLSFDVFFFGCRLCSSMCFFLAVVLVFVLVFKRLVFNSI